MARDPLAIDLTGRAHGDFCTLSEAAAQLGCTTDDVFGMVRSGQLPSLCTSQTGFVVARQDLQRLQLVEAPPPG